MKKSACSIILTLCAALGSPILFAQHALSAAVAKPAKAVISTLVAAPGGGSLPSVRSSSVGRPVRVTLVNMSGRERQFVLKSEVCELPVGQRFSVDSHVGDTLFIVSDTDSKVDERIVVKSGDDARTMVVR